MKTKTAKKAPKKTTEITTTARGHYVYIPWGEEAVALTKISYAEISAGVGNNITGAIRAQGDDLSFEEAERQLREMTPEDAAKLKELDEEIAQLRADRQGFLYEAFERGDLVDDQAMMIGHDFKIGRRLVSEMIGASFVKATVAAIAQYNGGVTAGDVAKGIEKTFPGIPKDKALGLARATLKHAAMIGAIVDRGDGVYTAPDDE